MYHPKTTVLCRVKPVFVRVLCAVVIVALNGVCAHAVDYHVDGRSGNDAHDGTSPRTAWRTLDKANKVTLEPGDRLLLRAGTRYAGQLAPKGAGTAEQPITVGKFGPGPPPRIDGQGKTDATLYLRNTQHITVEDLEITNTGPTRKAHRNGVLVHLDNFGTAKNITLRRLHIHDVNGSLVKRAGGGRAILWHNAGDRVRSRFDGLLIERCRIVRCGRDGIKGRSAYTHRDNWHPSLNVVIRHNTLEQVPGDGIVPIGCDGALVEHNVMRDCPRLLPDGEAAAGIWPWSSDHTVIQHNEVSGHKAPWDAQGFDSDWNCNGTVIQYNYSHDNEGGFLLVCNKGDVTMPYSAGNNGTIVRYNISINDGLRAAGKRAGFSPTFHITGPVKDTKIYNNLILVPRKPDAKVDTNLVVMGNWGGAWPSDTLFANNLFITQGKARFTFGKDRRTVFSHNLYHGEIAGAAELDAHAVLADPRLRLMPWRAIPFADLRNLSPRVGSPAVGAGRPIDANGGRDFAARPIGTPPTLGPLEPVD